MEAKDPFDCAKRGDVDFFNTVAPEIILEARDERDNCVLTVAAKKGHLDCCEVIVERCTQLLYHQSNYFKWSVLHHVVVFNHDKNVENILRFLITADSKPDLELGGGAKLPNNSLLTMQTMSGKTALHLAFFCQKHGAIKLLLEADRDFELLRMVDVDGRTCLHIAAEEGDHMSADLIKKARPDNEFLQMTERKSNQTALHIAVGKKNLAIVKLLLEADHSNDLLAMVDSHQQTTLHVAAKRGKLDMVKLICEADPDKQLLSMPDSQGNTPLHLAVSQDNLDYCANYYGQTPLLMAIDKAAATRDGSGSGLELGGGGKLPNKRLLTMQNIFGGTALHEAVRWRNHGATKLLLEADRDFELPRMVDKDGRTCLHLAAVYSDHVAAELMIKARPDIEFLKMTERQSNQTALHIAVEKKRLAIVQLLLKADHSNDLLAMVDSNQQTALHIAVKTGNLDMVKLICEADPDKQLVSMPDSQGNTPLHLASRDSRVEIVRLLTEGDMEAKLRSQVAITCAKRGDVDFFKKVAPKILLRARDAGDINTVLTVAAREGHLDCCEVIVKRCTPLLYHQDKYKWSVLHDVANSSNNLENILRFLITADSKPYLQLGGGGEIPNKRLLTMQTRWGGTALHKAVQNRKHWATKLLLEADRDFELLRMVDNYGRTCLHIAAEKGDHVLAKLIIKARRDNKLLSMLDSQGNTPLHLAVGNNNLEMARLLIEGDMVIDYCANNSNKTPLLMAMDKAAASDGSGSDSLVICKLLLEKDPSQCTKLTGDKGWTPLHLAASYGLNSVVNDIFRLCSDCINIVDFHGQNVLHIAAYHGHRDVVQQFLESKDTDVVALLNTQDKDGNTPLAVSKGNVEAVRLLPEAHPISSHTANISKQTPYMMTMGKILSDGYGGCSKSDWPRRRTLGQRTRNSC